MEKSFVFDSVNGDRRYKAEDFREFFASFIGNGVFPNPSTNLQVIANSNMTITIKQGKAWINGAIYINTDDYIVPIVNADGVLNRIDRVVLRMDTSERKIYSYVKKGTFSSTPVAPTLQRDADAYELALADVKVDKGTISITQANITDLRQNKNYCGIVHGTVEQIDITTLFNQYAAKLDEKEIEFEEEFKIWFETVKGQLSGDVAGNLAIQIEANKKKIEGVETNVKSQLEDMTKQIEGIELTAEKVNLSGVAGINSKNVKGAIQELFTNADNAQKGISNVIGSPLSASDTLTIQKDKIQTLKNTFASNLTLKGQGASGSERLSELINKVIKIDTISQIKFEEFNNLIKTFASIDIIDTYKGNIYILTTAYSIGSGHIYDSNLNLIREYTQYNTEGNRSIVTICRNGYIAYGQDKYYVYDFDNKILETISTAYIPFGKLYACVFMDNFYLTKKKLYYRNNLISEYSTDSSYDHYKPMINANNRLITYMQYMDGVSSEMVKIVDKSNKQLISLDKKIGGVVLMLNNLV